MQLSYRGVNYETQATHLPNIDNLIVAKYRGVNYLIPQRNIFVKKDNSSLKYRGINYQGYSILSLKEEKITNFKKANA